MKQQKQTADLEDVFDGSAWLDCDGVNELMTDRYLYHVTLQTGHTRKSYRSEVSAEAIAFCRDLLERINAGERVEIPPGGYFVSGRISGKCASFSVYAGGDLIVAFGVAENERCGAQLWRGLHNAEGLSFVTDPGRQPGAPWIGVALSEALTLHPQAADFLGDFERCLSWAFLMREGE